MTLPIFIALILVAGSTWGDPYTITADEKAAIETGVLSILRYPEVGEVRADGRLQDARRKRDRRLRLGELQK